MLCGGACQEKGMEGCQTDAAAGRGRDAEESEVAVEEDGGKEEEKRGGGWAAEEGKKSLGSQSWCCQSSTGKLCTRATGPPAPGGGVRDVARRGGEPRAGERDGARECMAAKGEGEGWWGAEG